jgi:hypothetical protein
MVGIEIEVMVSGAYPWVYRYRLVSNPNPLYRLMPALTAQQWHERNQIGAIWLDNGTLDVIAPDKGWGYMELRGNPEHELKDKDRHAMAALCLCGQPFGFVQQDVETLKRACINNRDDVPPICGDEGRLCRVCSIAARIEALLPPNSGSHSAID